MLPHNSFTLLQIFFQGGGGDSSTRIFRELSYLNFVFSVIDSFIINSNQASCSGRPLRVHGGGKGTASLPAESLLFSGWSGRYIDDASPGVVTEGEGCRMGEARGALRALADYTANLAQSEVPEKRREKTRKEKRGLTGAGRRVEGSGWGDTEGWKGAEGMVCWEEERASNREVSSDWSVGMGREVAEVKSGRQAVQGRP